MKKEIMLGERLLDIIAPLVATLRGHMRDVPNAELTAPQLRVLGFVALRTCTTRQLADWQGVSLPAMSRMVDHLARRGLLVRSRDTHDRRQINLALSAKGRVERARMRRVLQRRL